MSGDDFVDYNMIELHMRVIDNVSAAAVSCTLSGGEPKCRVERNPRHERGGWRMGRGISRITMEGDE